jgi:hypothetical protein
MMFTELPSVRERWPDLHDGIEIVERAFEQYGVNMSQTIKFFDDEGHEMITPHVENLRAHAQVIRKYVNFIKRYGIVQGVRGAPWALLSTDNMQLILA